VIEKVLPNNPHFVYANSSYRGYGIAHFETKKLTTTLTAVEDVKNASSGAFTLAQFVVEAGSKTIVKTI
jgi:phosphodiesterase/alkaline phosphatase D-like protein